MDQKMETPNSTVPKIAETGQSIYPKIAETNQPIKVLHAVNSKNC